jgi:hypothetical protein
MGQAKLRSYPQKPAVFLYHPEEGGLTTPENDLNSCDLQSISQWTATNHSMAVKNL